MKSSTTTIGALLAILLVAGGIFWFQDRLSQVTEPLLPEKPVARIDTSRLALAYVAGGCFWCVESDLEKVPGVERVISGYMGGNTASPTYKNYAAGGHREAVEVLYDPARLSFADLITYHLRHIDPTDGNGSFVDRGREYAPALYYQNEQERALEERLVSELGASGRFDRPMALPVLPATPFFSAEEYHQDYAEKNTLKYTYYRQASGRDAFLAKHWSEEELAVPVASVSSIDSVSGDWSTFMKPDTAALKQSLSPLAYEVTQEDGTEPAFNNAYWNHEADGIYVDIVSGEPLFSSTDKYDSGTGWPSFTKPIEPNAVEEREDRSWFSVRTEIRSRSADSHLGHVFSDGPAEKGGRRYCMNSAALRFIPISELAGTRYEKYLSLFAGAESKTP